MGGLEGLSAYTATGFAVIHKYEGCMLAIRTLLS